MPVPLQTYKMTTGATGAKCEADNSAKSKLLIAGIVLAGVVLCALLFAALMFWRYEQLCVFAPRLPLSLITCPLFATQIIRQADAVFDKSHWSFDSRYLHAYVDSLYPTGPSFPLFCHVAALLLPFIFWLSLLV